MKQKHGALQKIQAVILAAGQGSRFKTGITKMISTICGQAMVLYPIKVMHELSIPTSVVVGFQKEKVKKCINNAPLLKVEFVEQSPQLGSGHALLCTKNSWNAPHIIVMNGDMPLINSSIIKKIIKRHQTSNADVTFAICHNIDPLNTFGRVIQSIRTIKIVETKHFTKNINDHPFVNAGVYVFKRSFLASYLSNIMEQSTTQEFYLTDLIEIASKNKKNIQMMEFPFTYFNGVNTFYELSCVEEIKRNEIIHYWMNNGVRFIMPHTNHVDFNVTIAKGTLIHPGVQLINATIIGENCIIGSHSVLDNSIIAHNCSIAPHTYILQNMHINTHTSFLQKQL